VLPMLVFSARVLGILHLDRGFTACWPITMISETVKASP